MWPRNHLLLIRLRLGQKRRVLCVPFPMAVGEDLIRSWCDFLRLLGMAGLAGGLTRLLAGRLGTRLSQGVGRRLWGRALAGKVLLIGGADLTGTLVEGLWRIWGEVRRGKRRTLLEIDRPEAEVSIRIC